MTEDDGVLSDESLMFAESPFDCDNHSDRGLPIRNYDAMDAWNDAWNDAWKPDGSRSQEFRKDSASEGGRWKSKQRS